MLHVTSKLRKRQNKPKLPVKKQLFVKIFKHYLQDFWSCINISGMQKNAINFLRH